MNGNRGWMIATGVLAVVAIAAVIWAVVAMTGNDHDSMMSGTAGASGQVMGGAGHDMGDMMGSGAATDGGEWHGAMMAMGGMPGMKANANGTMSMSDQAFIAMMVPHHQMAVDMAKIELARGTDAQTKAFAKKVIAAQSEEIAQMRAWYRNWYGTDVPDLPMSPAMGMMGMNMDMDALRSTSEPDRLFLTMMQPHHAGAILMADAALAGSPRAELATLEKQIVAAQSTEMGQMQAMRQRIAPPLG